MASPTCCDLRRAFLNDSDHRRRPLTSVWVGVSVLTSLATLLAFAGAWWWPFELLCHFRVHYIWLLVPLSIGLLIIKQYKTLALTTACLLWNLILVVPIYFPQQGPVGSVTFRLMSANVHTSNQNYDQFIESVREANPDVLLVMEVDDAWMQSLQKLRVDFPYGDSKPRPDNFGIAFFSKLPVETIRIENISAARVPSVLARLTAGRAAVTVVGSHPLPPRGGRRAFLRNEQLSLTAGELTALDGPLVVAGDLNITPWSPFFRRFLRRTGLRDSRRGFGVQPTWPSRYGMAGIPIDHILVSDEISVQDGWVGPASGSDHRSVIADLSVGHE